MGCLGPTEGWISMDIDETDRSSYAMWSLDNNPDGIFWTDPGGNILYANSALCEEIGYSMGELLRMSVLDIDPMVKGDDLGPEGKLSFPIRSGDITHMSSCHKHKDGHLIPIEVTMSVPRDDGRLIVCFARDMSEERRIEAKLDEEEQRYTVDRRKLMKAASTDFLTGAWLRRYFFKVAASEMSQAERHKAPLSLLMVDIDRFKEVNDRFGHNTGDRVLVKLCNVIANSIREEDYFVRWGGEEFILLMPGLDADGALAMGERLKALVERSNFDEVPQVTVSIGVALYRPGEDGIDSWVARADAAMYEAKNAGRNKVEG